MSLNDVKQWICAAQQGSCLLCDFPLTVCCHRHHIIAEDDGGPEDPLNLVALCPNHHYAVEQVRRNLIPMDVSRDHAWQARAEGCKQVCDGLDSERRTIFDALSHPHPFRGDLRATLPDDLRPRFAREVARADADLLLKVYLLHPGVDAITDCLRRLRPHLNGRLCAVDFEHVIFFHLTALGLPFDASWLQPDV